MAISPPEISEEGGRPLDTMVDFVRSLSIWPVTMGPVCCTIEMMVTAAPHFDIVHSGSEVPRVSPRHADVIPVSGRANRKTATIMCNVCDETADPKWVIFMGTCASSGGALNNYAVVQDCDHVVPIGIYSPGCPPRPEILLGVSLTLRGHAEKDPLGKRREEAIHKVEAAALKAVPISDLKGLMA